MARSRAALLTLVLGACLGVSAEAAAQRPPVTRAMALGSQIEWTFDRNRQPVRYRFGEVTLTVRGVRETPGDDLIAPEVAVAAPGRPPLVMRGASAFGTAPHTFGVGRFDRAGTLFVMLQSFTGGAHCCNEVEVALIEPRRIRLIELGEWDGGPGGFPRDEDGDGLVDFVQQDDSFLYTFASYAESLAPPQILNIVDGRVVDVSTRPGFRPIFQRAVNHARPYCLARRREDASNGACAAYVAAAARIGQFDAAWTRMLRAYNQSFEWELPTDCRVQTSGECPQDAVISYRTFPEALRAFLVRHGYIPG